MRDLLNQVRGRQSYQEWQDALKFLDNKPTKEEIMKYIHNLLNNHSAYGSITKANYSQESLDLVLRDYNQSPLQADTQAKDE